MEGSPTAFNPVVALMGSLLFCGIPLYYAGFALHRKVGAKREDVQTVLVGLGFGLLFFALFLFWLGSTRGVYPATVSLLTWCIGVWQAARRNEVQRRFYVSASAATKTAQQKTTKDTKSAK
jgi:apolipoprotein N-acyltransferase